MKFDVIFVCVTYMNYQDLEKFLNHLSSLSFSSKTIVVNNYFDKKTNEIFKSVANRYNCAFIETPNLGYGEGNNIGIKYAKDNFEFDFLIISNTDVIIEKLDFSKLYHSYGDSHLIIAPRIINLKSNNQNPFRLFDISLMDKIKYISFKYKINFLLYIDIAINKTFRFIINLFIKKNIQIYSSHGCFIIFSKNAIVNLEVIFNKEMFLFSEEDHLAKLLKSKKMKIMYDQSILIKHFEDGTVANSNVNIKNNIRDSYIKFYEYWYLTKRYEKNE